MKLASLKSGRDGQLVVVSRDLARCLPADGIAPTLQAALDDWSSLAPRLQALYARLCASDGAGDAAGTLPFDPRRCAAPLPRAYHWVDGSAYVNHVELVRQARGAAMPESFWTDPLVYQGGSDDLLGPTDDARFVDESHGIDLEGEVAVITDDVPMGTTVADAAAHIRLLVLVNDWSLRNLIPGELAKGFGFYQSKPATAFSPVAITPDELGDDWRDGRVHRPLRCLVNDALLGAPDAGSDMTFGFPELLAHVTRTRRAGAGTVLGSGTVSNRDRSRGSACLAERRTLEQIEHGAPRTPFLAFGDRVRMEMLDRAGKTLFGAIEQRVVPA